MAFAGPSYERSVSSEGYCTLSPKDYIPYFKKRKVGLVVRLNRKAYNEEDFIREGIQHLEHFYTDGSCPPMRILDRVLEAFDTVPADQAFAVHCKAGLGRTGTCIGAWIMKQYSFTAEEGMVSKEKLPVNKNCEFWSLTPVRAPLQRGISSAILLSRNRSYLLAKNLSSR